MRRLLTAVAVTGLIGLTSPATAQFPNVLLQEDFNGLTLGPSVNDRRGPLTFAKRTVVATDATTAPVPNAFTHTPPTDWSIDNNFDSYGRFDMLNAGGSDVFSVDPPNELLFRTGLINVVVGNKGVGNQGSAEHGTDEWEGWSFARKDFWSSVDQQGREQFALASGTIAVADPDEYDDLGDGLGGRYYNTGLTTAPIPVSGLPFVELGFDSSWQPESYDENPHPDMGFNSNNQTAVIYAIFDNGTPQVIPPSLWNSDAGHTNDPLDPEDKQPDRPASGTFKPTALSESVSHFVTVPAGAQEVKFTFGLINAANDWWWAIDNLRVSDGINAPFWTENFDGLALGDSVNERVDIAPTFSRVTANNDDANSSPYPDAFTHTPPAGWNIDNSGIPAAAQGNNNIGVFEWEGWSFSNKPFWAFAGQGGIDAFTKADGVIAIADSDEFDDFNGGAQARPYNTLLTTPEITITGLPADALRLKFDSAWRDEGNQTAIVTVDFGGGEIEVLRWESSSGSPFFHDDNFNETVLLSLPNPAGATTAQIRFKYLNGSNNWFWGIDNVVVGAVPEPAGMGLAAFAVAALAVARRRS